MRMRGLEPPRVPTGVVTGTVVEWCGLASLHVARGSVARLRRCVPEGLFPERYRDETPIAL